MKSLAAITVLFVVTLVGIFALRAYDEKIDSTFYAMIGGMVMTMAGFIIMHFKTQAVENKLESTAKEQTVELQQQTAELKDAIVENQPTESNNASIRRPG